MSKNITTADSIRNLAAEVKKGFVKKEAFASIQTAAEKAIKSLDVTGNTISFFTSTDKTGDAAFTVDFPAEMFLDQTKTEFVPSFAFSAATYAKHPARKTGWVHIDTRAGKSRWTM